MAPKHFNRKNKNIYRGYFPFLKGDPSLKEFYDMTRPFGDISEWERKGCRVYEKLPWTMSKDHQWIIDKFQSHFKLMHDVCLKLIGCIAIGLGKDQKYFEPWFKNECTSTFRAIHNKPRTGKFLNQTQLDAKNFGLVTPEHCDSGFMTLLSTFGYHGLQIEIDGEYFSIPPVKDAIALNVGDMLAKLSGYRLKATRHRVLDIGCERFSCPFFLEPKFSARINDKIISSSRTQCEDFPFDKNPKK